MVAKKPAKKPSKNSKNWLTSIGALVVLTALFGMVTYQYYQRSSSIANEIAAEQIDDLAGIFARIDATAGILSFEHEKNYIDFLTVISFVGSEVGSMNLRNAEAWEGPYLKDNPTLQEKYYVIVSGKQGYYIAPGDGVKLSNGKVIGKDIIINKDTDFDKLANNSELFLQKGQPLVRKIK